jgi:hypothetical protein
MRADAAGCTWAPKSANEPPGGARANATRLRKGPDSVSRGTVAPRRAVASSGWRSKASVLADPTTGRGQRPRAREDALARVCASNLPGSQ